MLWWGCSNPIQICIFLEKETIPFNKYPTLSKFLVVSKANCIESMYHDKKSCDKLLFCMSNVLQKSIMDGIIDLRMDLSYFC